MTNLSDKLMQKYLDQDVLYNWSWEDPCIDISALKINSQDRIATIASAGDNCFCFLSQNEGEAPLRIDACDINSRQIALVDLKRACILGLSYQNFWKIFAEDDVSLLKSSYEKLIKPHLKETDSVAYWDKSIPKMKSIMYLGASGLAAKIALRGILHPILGHFGDLKYSPDGKPFKLLTWLIGRISGISLKLGFHCLQGVPKRQLNLYRGSLSLLIANGLRRLSKLDSPNYFYNGYCTGKYTKNCCPQYMLEPFYLNLKKNINRLHLHVCTLESLCKKLVEKPTIVLPLDSMDWMSEKEVSTFVQQLIDTASDAKVLWKSFDSAVHACSLFTFLPKKVDDSLDRVAMYQSTWLGKVPSNP